ncbi:4-amino-4-deoxy-L-arabinose transferase-like glycosyltransferase [Hoeflea marina]|uniref:4-amino-4-deoxy-L-arabinose transferase-like glycosyltransferase n=1 Tax=Hoeflea marina TaxID=274592 RepID=A0A317PNW3_9HYPH|nr:glycosyltransferase family 39 protein [Hoeflea marina]PWW02273.1 4-amino-4-deoxy-L-arabinose transferase-like glycosyltransferase [Hoeflea marina]
MQPAPMARSALGRWQGLVLAIGCLLAFLPGLMALPPIDRDEARFVQASKQMLETGDYVDIRFQDEHRYKKPVGIYWLQTAAVRLTGQGPEAGIWAYRLASVAAGTVAVVTIASLGTWMFGPAVGLAAGIMLAGLFGLGFEARLAKTDATLMAITLIGQAALARLYIGAREGDKPERRWWWVFWLAIGAGLLVKGPITPLVSALTVAGIAILDRDRAWLRGLRPLPGLALALLVVLPWFVAITLKSGGAFWAESVGKDLIGKVASGQESHGAPPGYYVLTYSLYMWPFGLIAILGGLKALNRFREPRLLFCLAWYIPFWLLLEIAPTKLPHYPLPAYPALLLLGAWALLSADGRDTPLRRWQVWFSWLTLFGLAAVTLVFASAAAAGVPWATGRISWQGGLAAILALTAGWLASGLGRPAMSLRRLTAAAVASAGFIALLAAQVVPAVTPLWNSPAIARAFEAGRPCPDSVLAAVGYSEPSLVFLAGTRTVLADLEGAAAHLRAEPACGVVVLPQSERPALVTLLGPDTALEDMGRISGINYSKGQAVDLVLVRRAP